MLINNETWQAVRPLPKNHLIALYLHDVERTGFDKTLTVIESCNRQEPAIFLEITSETVFNEARYLLFDRINIFLRDAFGRATDPKIDGYYFKRVYF